MRQRSKEDERSVIISLTQEGRDLRDKALEVPKGIGSCIRMEPQDAMQLKALLGKLLEAFD
jgi:DNA-binding MarR family transcriptional regulator